jgi:uncharacterized membrane-anchored protein
MAKRLDNSTAFVFGLCTFCLLVTFVAIGANANDESAPPTIQTISTAPDALALENEEGHLSETPARDLIMRQIIAIKDRDAQNAMQTTTPRFQKQKKITNSKEFLNKMRFDFRPLYSYQSYEFTDNKRIGKSIIQKVAFTSKDGDTITAIYRLTKNESGEWLIDSLALMPLKDAEPI